ncbi:MAG: glycosyltransferase [Candidatus Lindowbacteria bacterium]|nr:glycosyltransferase [Candidatus Lindowbacteria bacterium]
MVRQFPVRYFCQRNQGPAKARNFGVENAKGDIVIFTDSDCVAERDWIELMTEPLRNGQISGVKGAYRTAQRSLAARFAQVEFEERYELLKKHEHIDFVDSYSAAFRKQVFLKAGGFDTSFPKANNEDTEFSYKLTAMGCKMVFAPDAIVYHRHPDTVWKYFRLKFGRGYWRMVVYRRYPEKMVKDSYTPQSLKLQMLLAFVLCCSLGLFVVFPALAVPASLLSLGAFLGGSLSFWRFAFKRDFVVGMAAPVFLFLRALALGSGVAWALLTRRKAKDERGKGTA